MTYTLSNEEKSEAIRKKELEECGYTPTSFFACLFYREKARAYSKRR